MGQNVFEFQLGYKTAAGDVNQETIKLGDEGIAYHYTEPTQDTTMEALVSSRPVTVRWVKNNQATALVAGQAVMRDVAGDGEHDVKDVTGANVDVVGFVDPYISSNVAEDEKFFIVVKGPTKVRTGDTSAAGTAIATAADGEAVECDLTVLAEAVSRCGTLLEAGVAGSLKWADVNCLF